MKRFLSVALALVMLLAAMPFAAFAEYDYPYAGDAYGVDFDQASTVFEEIKIGLQEAIDGDIYRENTLSTDESEENNG